MQLEEELKLIESAKGDFRYFDKVYRFYVKQIYNFCLNRVGGKEEAEDITSQVFIKVLAKLNRFDTKRNIGFKSWLYRIAHNTIIDYFRKNKAVSLDEKILPGGSELADDIQAEFTQAEIRKQVLTVLKKLKPRYRLVISLKFFSELSNQEIAEILDVKVSNIGVVIHRALNSFQKLYQKKYPNSEIFNLN